MFNLKDLPYDYGALEPYISAKTLEFHYSKHHFGYVKNLNDLIQNTYLSGEADIKKIIRSTASMKDESEIKIFNNAAQAYNHEFYWGSLVQNGGGIPDGKLILMINAQYGSFEKFILEFKNAALTQFGSGWTWLALNISDKTLKIIKTSNAFTPVTDMNLKPLLVIDVWEHAYYLDFQNRRGEHLDGLFEHVLNWKFAEKNLSLE